MTNEEKELWESVHYRKEEEGMHYCFVHYSYWEDIKDEKFHELRLKYIEAAKNLEEYINKKVNDE